MKIVTVGCWALACSSFVHTATAELNLMPQPAKVVPGQGKLSDVVEPVKEYSREEARQYTSFTLNRLVDATRPESDVAREFSSLVDRAVAGASDASASRDQLRHWLTLWRANDAALQPALQDSFLLQELMPHSAPPGSKLSIPCPVAANPTRHGWHSNECYSIPPRNRAPSYSS
jgi:hypothetical protein